MLPAHPPKRSESMKQRKMLYSLEKEREKFGAEASDANAKFAAALEEVKLREMTILDLQKKISEGDTKLKQQQVSAARHSQAKAQQPQPSKHSR